MLFRLDGHSKGAQKPKQQRRKYATKQPSLCEKCCRCPYWPRAPEASPLQPSEAWHAHPNVQAYIIINIIFRYADVDADRGRDRDLDIDIKAGLKNYQYHFEVPFRYLIL